MSQQQNSQVPTVPSDLQTFGTTVVSSANQLSTSGSSMTALVQTARVNSLKRAAAVAVATYGATSKEATAANQAVTTAQAKSGQLQVVSQKASTTQPAVASTGWALHGRVYDANLNPQESYTVFLVDSQKNYLSDYGFAYTDPSGYFLIQYAGASASGPSGTPGAAPSSNDEELIDLNLSAATENPSQPSQPSSSSTSGTASPPQAFIEVCDANANPVLQSSTAFAPVTGQATYQVLTLAPSQKPLGDPPAEIRAVAMPPATAKTTKASKGSSSKK